MAGSTRTLRRLSFSNCGLGDTKFQILVRPSTRDICIQIDWCSCTRIIIYFLLSRDVIHMCTVVWQTLFRRTWNPQPCNYLSTNRTNAFVLLLYSSSPKRDRSRNPSGETGLQWTLKAGIKLLNENFYSYLPNIMTNLNPKISKMELSKGIPNMITFIKR